MAGLYDGLEEIPFKAVPGGYVFQTNNAWLIGPRRRYFVTDTKKAEIAACLRDTLRRIKPFVLAAAILIAAILVAAVFWFATRGATLNVTITEPGHETISYSQPIGPDGTTGTLAGAEGSHVVFKVSGPPGAGATVAITGFAANGKAGAPCAVKFGSGGTVINMNNSSNETVKIVRLVGRAGRNPGAVAVFSGLLTLGLFGLYIASLHVYGSSRLRPLLAGLPRSNQRITLREGMERYAARMSNRLLAVMAFGAVAMTAGTAINLTEAIFSRRSADSMPFVIIAAAASLLVTAKVGYLTAQKVRLRRHAV